jgi:hypothetical protein
MRDAAFASSKAFLIEELASLKTLIRQTQTLLHQCREIGHTAYQLGCLKLLRQLHLDMMQFGRAAIDALVDDSNASFNQFLAFLPTLVTPDFEGSPTQFSVKSDQND